MYKGPFDRKQYQVDCIQCQKTVIHTHYSSTLIIIHPYVELTNHPLAMAVIRLERTGVWIKQQLNGDNMINVDNTKHY